MFVDSFDDGNAPADKLCCSIIEQRIAGVDGCIRVEFATDHDSDDCVDGEQAELSRQTEAEKQCEKARGDRGTADENEEEAYPEEE